MEPERGISPPALPLSKKESFPPSAKMSMNQLGLSVLDKSISHRIIRLLGYKTVSYGNERDGIRFPYFSSVNTIKRSLEVQEENNIL